MNSTARQTAAFDFLQKGWSPLPVPARKKNPNRKGWQKYQATADTINDDFSGDGNIGLLLGNPSSNLVDTDLDWLEAQALAPYFLPETKMHSGRAAAPNSHSWYICEIKTQQFADPNLIKQENEDKERAMIVEIRSTGGQTIVAPSVHPSGEPYEWSGELEPATVEANTLRTSVSRLASCALFCRYWRIGIRHYATLALTGTLLRNQWTVEEVQHFVKALATVAKDEEIEDRLRAVTDTANKLNEGENVTGLPRLAELFGEKTVNALSKWLGLRNQSEVNADKPVEQVRQANNVATLDATEMAGHISYKANGIGLVWLKPVARDGGGGTIPVQLSNFVAEIVSDVEQDDGAEQTRQFEVKARLACSEDWRKGFVSADEFDAMRWPSKLLGARAVVYPAQKERASVAIRLLSEGIADRRVVAHTGWRNDDGRWLYYHNAGAIGADGLIDAEVSLPPAFSPFVLPEPLTGDELKASFLAVLEIWNVAPLTVTVPLTGAALNSVLGGADYSQFLFGYTGSGKTQLAALAQSFFGAGFDADHLPASWSSTGNSLEALAHAAKDCLLVVDDFCPTGSANDQSRLHVAADRILRAQGNHSGRARCRVDGSVRAAKPPRGLIIATGEDVPRGQSLRARLLVAELPKGAIDWQKLTECQRAAREGVYAKATSAFIRWLATDGRIGQLQENAAEQISALRTEWLKNKALSDSHKRAVTTLAQIARAWKVWLRAACEFGAMSKDDAEARWQTILKTLGEVGTKQAAYQASENPATRFIELIQAALSSGKAHLAAVDGGKPEGDLATAFGWRDGEPQGDRIGWIEGDDLYLQPDASYRCAQSIGAQGEGLAVGSQTLWKRLNEIGYVKSKEADDRLRIRKTIAGKREKVIHLSKESFTG